MQQQRRVGIDAQTAHLEQVGLGAGSGRSERGRHATTVADIAAAAEMAPRTARLYFRSEQDIAVSWFIESIDRLTAQLRDREPHDAAMEILGRWLRTEGQDDETNRFEHRMFASNRELRASHMTVTLDAAVKALAEELGAAFDDIGPRIATTLAFLEAGMPTLRGRYVT
ncbi:TetR family transcriptional regulator [Streptomyces mirabilis]|uniref:TetR family transcriptional regulator n=1 Tax=Streptomyces mirabilis TaxID=68239 RepID=UPI002E1E1CB7|nr:TetR family transcriptional regulator [Streptomyces mirabilis]